MKTQLKYSVSNFIKLLENLILNIGLARVILDLVAFGKVQQFLVIVTFIVTLSSAFPTTLNYFISKYTTGTSKQELFKRFFFSMCLLAFFSGVLLLLLKHEFYEWFKNDFFLIYIKFFMPIIIAKVVNTFFSNYYLFSNKLEFFNIISFVFLIVYFLGFTYFSIRIESINHILLFLMVYELAKFLILLIPFTKSEKIYRTCNNLIVNKQELKFVLPTMLLVLAGILNMQIDKYMISALETPEVFAFYQVGAFNIPFIAVVTTSFFTIITPELTSLLRSNKIKKTLIVTALTVKQTSVLLLPIVIFCFFFSNEIIELLFGDKFHSSGEIFKVYTLRFLISVFPFSIYMGIIGLKNLASIHVIISALINIVLNFFLLPRFGVMGAVTATLIASYTTVLIPIYFINKKLKTRFIFYFPIGYLFKVIIISIALAYPIYYFCNGILKEQSLFYVIPISVCYYLISLFVIERKTFVNLLNKLK